MHLFFHLIHFRELRQKYKNIFVRFLVQMKTLNFAFEIKWPLTTHWKLSWRENFLRNKTVRPQVTWPWKKEPIPKWDFCLKASALQLFNVSLKQFFKSFILIHFILTRALETLGPWGLVYWYMVYTITQNDNIFLLGNVAWKHESFDSDKPQCL